MGFDASIGLDVGGLTSGILNYKAQKKNLKWQKYVQGETWRREDNAHQRAVADLRAAGLSPTLAASSASNAGQVVSTQAPQIDLGETGKTTANADLLGLLTMKGNIAKLDLENELLKAKRVESNASAWDKSVAAKMKEHDLGISKKSATETNPGAFMKTTRNIANVFDDVLRRQAQAIENVRQQGKYNKGKTRLSTSSKPPKG